LLGISTSKLEELTCSVLTQFAIKLVVLWSSRFVSQLWKQFSILYESEQLRITERSAPAAEAWAIARLLTRKRQPR
jgi:hypothetical protein